MVVPTEPENTLANFISARVFLDSVGSTAWSEAYSETFIFNEGEKYPRGFRKIPSYH